MRRGSEDGRDVASILGRNGRKGPSWQAYIGGRGIRVRRSFKSRPAALECPWPSFSRSSAERPSGSAIRPHGSRSGPRGWECRAWGTFSPSVSQNPCGRRGLCPGAERRRPAAVGALNRPPAGATTCERPYLLVVLALWTGAAVGELELSRGARRLEDAHCTGPHHQERGPRVLLLTPRLEGYLGAANLRMGRRR